MVPPLPAVYIQLPSNKLCRRRLAVSGVCVWGGGGGGDVDVEVESWNDLFIFLDSDRWAASRCQSTWPRLTTGEWKTGISTWKKKTDNWDNLPLVSGQLNYDGGHLPFFYITAFNWHCIWSSYLHHPSLFIWSSVFEFCGDIIKNFWGLVCQLCAVGIQFWDHRFGVLTSHCLHI